MVRNTMNLVNQAAMVINEEYDMSAHNLFDIHKESGNEWDLIINGFRFGYMQGIKAAKADKKKTNL